MKLGVALLMAETLEATGDLLTPLYDLGVDLNQLVLLTDKAELATQEGLPTPPSTAAAEYMPLSGVWRDLVALVEMRDPSAFQPGDPVAAIVVNAMAPSGWHPGWLDMVARP